MTAEDRITSMAINALSQLHQTPPSFVLDVDRESRIPLYEQLCRQLRQAIQEGRLDPSEPLAPEPELAAWLGVSRFTLRQALGQLVREGLLRRQRGRGTFVVEACADAGIAAAGLRATDATDVEILEVGLCHTTSEVAALLGIDPSSRAVEIVQQRSAHGRIIAVERIILNGHSLPLGGLADLTGDNLPALLDEYGKR
jgi:GntR family transcriptional regulator